MKLGIKSEGNNYVEITMEGEDIGLAGAIRELLVNDSNVEFAACVQDHPQVGAPKLVVRTKGKGALAAVREAVRKLKKEVSEFRSELKERKARKAKG